MHALQLLAQAQQEPTSLLDYIKHGGMVGAVLIIMSIAAVALIIALAIEVRLTKMAPEQDVEALTRLLREGGVAGAIEYCRREENDSFLTRLFGLALTRCSRSQFGLLELRSALEEGGQRQVERLYRLCDWVALLAAVAPMLGLLGTVFGMIGAFGAIGNLEGAARSQGLADHMSLALVATAMGLGVAIPCTALFSVFRRRIDRLAEEVGDIAERIAQELQTKPGAMPSGAPQAAAPRPMPRPAPSTTRPPEMPEARAS